MARRALVYRWEWSLASSPEELWPLVSDTNRFNFETGAPAIEPLAVAGGRKRLRLRAAGRTIEYEEEPFEWVRPERFGVVRRYRSGPLAELRARLELEPLPDGGTRLRYEADAVPRGLFGAPILRLAIGRVARARMDTAFRRCDRVACGAAVPPARATPRLASGGSARAETLRAGLSSVAPPELVGRLVDTVVRSDDLELARLRPYALADAWEAGRRDVLELCLHATRAGLLEARWELVCPLCRGSAQTTTSLAGLARSVHCDSCQIDVSASLDSSIELTFRPSPAVRDVPERTFCVGGPGVTPHIVAQQVLAPREERTVELALEEGSYRVRTIGAAGARPFAVAVGSARSPVAFVNDSDEAGLVVAERTAFADQAATAADVTALQAFRDLFAAEALRPGEELSVGSLAVVFTDLRDSTRLYREIGDASAFGSVASHFDVLRETFGREGGALVKTIGDAVMAVSRRPATSLVAVLDAQTRLSAPADGSRPLLLKAGIHAGPCIAVTLNERLDYFGSTVNAAARIVGLSSGRDVVISGAVRADPEVDELLASGGLRTEPVDAVLKGFEGEPFELWRVGRDG